MSLPEGVAEALGSPVLGATPVAGGDVNLAFRLRLVDGREVFCKTHPDPPPSMFAAEARGLDWLRVRDGLPVPPVLAVGSDFLVLPWLAPGGTVDPVAVGRGLAHTHRSLPPGTPPGLDHANLIGTVPQDNTPAESWPAFYRDRRIWPLAQSVEAALGARLLGRIQALCEALPDRLGPPEPMARLHGDLWSGNLHQAAGRAWLIDPAVVAGHRELDLAMMKLFGGFSVAVFDAYDEVWPLAPGWQARTPLYQLYYLLVHVRMFGAGWVPRVAAVLNG